MEKELELFRRECVLKRRIQRMLLFVQVSLTLFGFVYLRGTRDVGYSDMGVHSMIALIPLTVYLGRFVVATEALHSEAALRKAYIAEHDERTITIRQRAGIPVVHYLSLGWGLLGALISFIDHRMAFLCGALLIVVCYMQVAVSLLLKKYWEKRM